MSEQLKPVMAVFLNPEKGWEFEINTEDESVGALALRKMNQMFDFHMLQVQRKERSSIIQATNAVQAIVPKTLLERLNG